MGDAVIFAIGFWLGGAFLTFAICGATMWQRLLSAALWFTFPMWRGR
jgi:hypothetical protein